MNKRPWFLLAFLFLLVFSTGVHAPGQAQVTEDFRVVSIHHGSKTVTVLAELRGCTHENFPRWRIYWGDGNERIFALGRATDHTYATTGNYTITFQYDCEEFGAERRVTRSVSILPPGVYISAESTSNFQVTITPTVVQPGKRFSSMGYYFDDDQTFPTTHNNTNRFTHDYQNVCGTLTIRAEATFRDHTIVKANPIQVTVQCEHSVTFSMSTTIEAEPRHATVFIHFSRGTSPLSPWSTQYDLGDGGGWDRAIPYISKDVSGYDLQPAA